MGGTRASRPAMCRIAIRRGSCARESFPPGREGGFTLIELMMGLALFATVSVFLLQGFVDGLRITSKSDQKTAATSLGVQIMELISASANPYTMVGFTGLARQALPLPSPYNSITNPTSHTFQAAVAVAQDPDLNLITITVRIYRPSDPDLQPFVSLTKVLHDQ